MIMERCSMWAELMDWSCSSSAGGVGAISAMEKLLLPRQASLFTPIKLTPPCLGVRRRRT